MSNYKRDIDGKPSNKADGACSCKVKHDRTATLASPRKISLDKDGPRLQKIAHEVYVTKTRTTLDADDATSMRALVIAMDGKFPYDNPQANHPLFISGVFLGALQRRGVQVAMDARATKPTTAPKKISQREKEAAAKENMRRESAAAWQKGKK